jgi:hypothetical protein
MRARAGKASGWERPVMLKKLPMETARIRLLLAAVALGMLVGASSTWAQEAPPAPAQPPARKPAYSLFHPAPRQELREMGTDRADQTQSPYTLDAGHFQGELDFCEGTLERQRFDGADRSSSLWSVAPFTLKLGLLRRAELDFGIEPHELRRSLERTTGGHARASGAGDLETALKVNVWGDDGGRTAFAILPFVKWPLPKSDFRNGMTEGGVDLPFALDLGRGWDVGAMTEMDFLARESGGRGTAWVNSVTLGRSVRGKMRAYAEFLRASAPSAHERWQGQVDAGSTFLVRDNLLVAFGCNFGVTRSAPDFAPFIGMALRL